MAFDRFYDPIISAQINYGPNLQFTLEELNTLSNYHTDFVTYTEIDEPILESSRSGGQDAWIGTGSVVKVDDTYYLFYTGHTGASNAEFKEKVMVAKGSDPYHFEKVEGWYINPPAELGQKNDFRDPQCYYDPDTGLITMTITASQSGTARILKYTVTKDLTVRIYGASGKPIMLFAQNNTVTFTSLRQYTK